MVKKIHGEFDCFFKQITKQTSIKIFIYGI